MVTKVTLRTKPIKGNKLSLFLDFYPPIEKDGKKTRREFLNLFLFADTQYEEQEYTDSNGKKQIRIIPVLNGNLKPRKIKLDSVDADHNQHTWMLARQIRNNRYKKLNDHEGLNAIEKRLIDKDAEEQEKAEGSFIDYFLKLADKRMKSNHDNWMAAYNYLKAHTGGTLKFKDVTETFCDGFREYLLTSKSIKSDKTSLSRNSALSYYLKFKAALKQAYRDGYLKTDINARIKSIKPDETRRNFLTMRELNKLVKTPCNNPVLKRAALFSALTGLRFSDIEKMTWREIEHIEGQGYFILYTQQKTKGVEVLPISEQAYQMLGENGEPDSKIFEGLTYSAYENKHLAKWIGLAGITKDVTFHSFRHTYATLQLSQGTDIYTVSKLLGHKDLKTTQIYAKVLDKTKQEAVNKIKLDL